LVPKFTYSFHKTRPLLNIRLGITDAWREELKGIGKPVTGALDLPATALLDTGASITTVDEYIIHKFNLKKAGTLAFRRNGSLEAEQTNRYMARITILPPESAQEGQWEQKTFETMRIAEGMMKMDIHGFNALIGIDVLRHCVLTYDGPNKVFTLDF
jgi:hypothetical protein